MLGDAGHGLPLWRGADVLSRVEKAQLRAGWELRRPAWSLSWLLCWGLSLIMTWLHGTGPLPDPPSSQDVPEQRSMEYPKLYEPGQLNLLFNKREFFICIAQGIYTSVLMFFIPYGVFADATRGDGAQLADYQSFAVTVATSLVIVVSVQVGCAPGGNGGVRLLCFSCWHASMPHPRSGCISRLRGCSCRSGS